MKAQTEIFGLVIVILLLSVGLLFAIGFMAKKEPPKTQKEFMQTELAYNLIEAMLGTTVSDTDATGISSKCDNLKVSELIQDCYEHDSATRLECSTGSNSCDYASNLIENTFLEKTLKEWKYDYYLTIIRNDPAAPVQNIDPISRPLGAKCPGSTDIKAVAYNLPSESVWDIKITLFLC